MGYFKDAVKGVSWMGLLRASMRGLAVVKIAILARFLTPAQFGNYGIALLVLGFLEVLTETGINVFLIQRKDGIKPYLDSAWVVSIARGVLIAIIILTGSVPVSRFFEAPQVIQLLYIVAGIAIVRGFINPMQITFQKDLLFKKEFLYRGFLYLVDMSVAVVLGIITKSESSMLFSMLISALMEVLLSFVLFKERPKFVLEKNRVREVLNNGKWVTGAGIFNYIFQNIDNFTIGKVLGTTSLGYYQQAYSISTLPVTEVGNIFNKVTLPIYVNISSDKTRLRKAFTRTLAVIGLLVIPFAVLIIFFSHPIILIFLGEKWLSIEPVLKILAVFGALKSILNFSYSLFLSLKLQKYVMFSELSGIAGMLAAIYPMTVKYGIVGAGYSTIIAFACSLPVVIYEIRKVLK